MDIQEAEVITPVFEPGKNYAWKVDDELPITGGQLNQLHNTLHMVFNEDIPDSKAWVMINALYKITSDIIKTGVEKNIIKEAEPQKTQ